MVGGAPLGAPAEAFVRVGSAAGSASTDRG